MDFKKETIIQELYQDKEFLAVMNENNLNSEDIENNFSYILSYKCKKDLCKGCKGVATCKQSYAGLAPTISYQGRFILDYAPCKFQQKVNFENEKKSHLVTLACNIDDIDETALTNVTARKEIYEELKRIQIDLSNGEHTKGLFVSGPYGCGKSYIIGALAKILANQGYKVVFAYYPDLVRKLKSSIGTNTLEKNVELLKDCDVLVLDDFGGESMSAFIRDEVLGAVLQERMETKALTFFTSNLDKNTLHNHLSQTSDSIDELKASRIEERIRTLTKFITLSDKNYRN